MSSARQKAKAVIVYTLIVLGTLGAVEIGSFLAFVVSYARGTQVSFAEALRFRIRQHPLAGETNPPRSLVFDPLLQVSNPAGGTWWGLRVNEYGFIGNGGDSTPVVYPFKAQGVVRVVLLGGSTVAGAMAPDNASTIAAYLERLLNGDPRFHVSFEVLNFGVGGYSVFSEVTKFFAEVAHVEPDIVVLVDGFNDAYYATSEHVRQGLPFPLMNYAGFSYKHFDAANGFATFRRQPPIVMTYTFKLAQSILEWAARQRRHSDRRVNARVNAYARGAAYRVSRQLRERYPYYENALEVNLRAVASYHAITGKRFFAYLQPFPLQFKLLTDHERRIVFSDTRVTQTPGYEQLMPAAFDRFATVYAKLEREFQSYPNVRFVDLRRLFERVDGEIYTDIAHYTPVGNERIARRIHVDLARSLLATRPARGSNVP